MSEKTEAVAESKTIAEALIATARTEIEAEIDVAISETSDGPAEVTESEKIGRLARIPNQS